MKTIKQGITAIATCLFLSSSIEAFAIEGLKLSVQCSDEGLSWPSIEGETYIVQYRPTLDPSTPWQTLTSSLPANVGTNLTFFIHTNIIQHPTCGGGGSFSMMAGGGEESDSLETDVSKTAVPMAIPKDGSGDAVPLYLYPLGFDLSNLLIFDPSSGEWVDGSGYSIDSSGSGVFSLNDLGSEEELDSFGGSSPETGFYQVVRVGVHILGLTNLTSTIVSNTISLPFEVGHDVGTLQEIYLLVDGKPYRGANPLIMPNFNPYALTVDTAFLENGDHTFQVEAGWLNPDIGDLNNFIFHLISDSFTLTVSNEISYPDWEPESGEYGFSAYFAETVFTNASYRIDIYDVGSNYVQALTGNATNGMIEAYWNLMDTNGVARTNTSVDTKFSSILTVATTKKKPLPPKTPVFSYPPHGQWVISYQDNFSFMANSNTYYTAIYNFGAIASQFGGSVTYFPSSPTNGQTFPLRYPYTNPVVNVSIPTMLLDIHALEFLLKLTNSSNFYYNGHGAAQGIASYLSSDMIANDLVGGHYYRFVFLDGCSTAKGKLAAAFGNNATSEQLLSYYQKRGIRPRVFLGYNHDVFYNEGGSFYDPYDGQTYNRRVVNGVWEFLTNLEFYWYYTYFGPQLNAAIYHAFIDSEALPSGWQNGDGLQIFGYGGIGIDDYNYH